MSDSLNSLKIIFEKSKQNRAQKTLEDLLQAAEKIVDGANVENFDARNLSKVSGYSLGTLIKRLGAIENIFLYTIATARTKKIRKLATAINKHSPETNCRTIVQNLVELAFAEIKQVGPSVIRYYESRALKRLSDPSKVYEYTNEVVDPLVALINTNKTGTFKKLTKAEAVYVARAIFLFIERPFVENDPIAGSDQHRELATLNILGLLEKKAT